MGAPKVLFQDRSDLHEHQEKSPREDCSEGDPSHDTKPRRNLIGRAWHKIDKRVTGALKSSKNSENTPPGQLPNQSSFKAEPDFAQKVESKPLGVKDDPRGNSEPSSPTNSMPCTPPASVHNFEVPKLMIPSPVQA